MSISTASGQAWSAIQKIIDSAAMPRPWLGALKPSKDCVSSWVPKRGPMHITLIDKFSSAQAPVRGKIAQIYLSKNSPKSLKQEASWTPPPYFAAGSAIFPMEESWAAAHLLNSNSRPTESKPDADREPHQGPFPL